jgi:FKBP-type peptidyl-prolyl cis-trans isomerase (trigger factor)
MTHLLKKTADGSIEITITVPWADITALHAKVVDAALKEVELPGFRKGKAPDELARKQLDDSKLYEEVIRKLIPEVYNEVLTKEKLHPIINPKVELKEAKEGGDWVLLIITCERPKIELKEYKKAVIEAKNAVKNKIWVPGTEPKPEDKEAKVSIDDLLKALYESVDATLPAILLEHEANRLLSELIDQTKKLGLTVEQYLASTKRTQESVRAEYMEQARRTLVLEFALEEIADSEGILISDDDIEAVIKSAKTDEERKQLEDQKYYLASVLRRQKTLDFISSL